MRAGSDAAWNWVNVHDFYHCFVVRTLLPNRVKLNPNPNLSSSLASKVFTLKFNDKV